MWDSVWDTLFPIFKWAETSWMSEAIRGSIVLFPIVETFHILALTLLFGAVVVVDLRLAGIILQDQPVSKLARDVKSCIFWSLVVILASGVFMATSEALKCWSNGPFRIKMTFLAGAIIFHYTFQRLMVRRDEFNHWLGKLTGAVSVVLWLGVGLGGKGIAFW